MKLESQNGSCFELAIIGYQFPEIEGDRFDSNWLLIKYSITNSKGTWTATDPCMLTSEVAELAIWLDKVSSGEKYQSEFAFMEPEIEFLCTQNETGEEVLRVYIHSEYAIPPTMVELWVEFLLEDIDLGSVAKNLRRQLEKFPERPGI